jgi:hypothetical protein
MLDLADQRYAEEPAQDPDGARAIPSAMGRSLRAMPLIVYRSRIEASQIASFQ